MDVPLTFYVMLAFLCSAIAFETRKGRYFILSGFICGLAASTKYQGLITWMWGPLACFIHAMEDKKKNPFIHLLDRHALIFIAFAVAGFVIGTPYSILALPEFMHHFAEAWRWFKPGGIGLTGGAKEINWIYYLSGPLSYGLGKLLLITALLGILRILLKPSYKSIYFISFPIVYYFISCFSSVKKSSYILPIVPFLCLTAGVFVGWLVSWLMRNKKSAWTDIVVLTICLLIAFPTAMKNVRYDSLKTNADTRELARLWIEHNVPKNKKVLVSFFSRIGGYASGPSVTRFDPSVFDTRLQNRSSLKALDEYRKEGFEYLVLDEWHLQSVLRSRQYDSKSVEIQQQYEVFFRNLESSAQQVAFFTPYIDESGQYDRENLHLPSRSLSKLDRFGPKMWIYKL